MSEKRICTAKTLKGLEGVLADELRAMGYNNVEEQRRAVSFESDLEGLYKANLNLRTALSVLWPLKSFRFKNKDDFFKQARSIVWEDQFDINKSFVVKTAVFGKAFNNTNYPALLVKDTVVDRFRNMLKRRPNIDKERPDVVIDVYVSDNNCTISLNSSGNPLFMRGYRNMPFTAPLNECLAAGMIYLSGWKANENFLNPMCGSGTLIVEATMMALNIHPAKLRNEFAFMHWRNYDSTMFEKRRKALEKEEIKSFGHKLEASDISNRAISITRNSLMAMGIENHVDLFKMNILKPKVNTKSGTIIINPPYDERLKDDEIEKTYEEMGSALKNNYENHEAWILSSHIEALKHVGLKTSSKIDLLNGKIPCKYQCYQMYSGSKK